MTYENIPEELKRLPQWVSAGKGDKTPMKSWEYAPASSTDPNTWATFEIAKESYDLGLYPYCGFVFADNGYVGIDIDDGFDEDNFISDLALDIIDHCQSYTERSKSGRGFHIIVKGTLPFKGKNNLAGVEIYRTARYFIMTGEIVFYPEIHENQNAIDYIVEHYFPNVQKESDNDFSDRIYSPKWVDPVENGKIALRPHYPKIGNGSRNISLTSLAGSLHTIGYRKSEILNELLYVNQKACTPPLSESEIKAICNSVTRYRR